MKLKKDKKAIATNVTLKRYLNIHNYSQSIKMVFKILNLYRVFKYFNQILLFGDLIFKYK